MLLTFCCWFLERNSYYGKTEVNWLRLSSEPIYQGHKKAVDNGGTTSPKRNIGDEKYTTSNQ